jgi:hypothetical protein
MPNEPRLSDRGSIEGSSRDAKHPEFSASSTGLAISSDVLAYAGVRVTTGMLPSLRHCPGPGVGESLPATFLRHADEQTVAGLAAVLHGIERSGKSVADFRDWGVVAAPCFLGRAMLAVALQRLASEGAWGISPHLIPHRSQHAVSGTISQVLKIFGPNLGAGGGSGSVLEAFLAALVLLEGNRLPGVWVVVTEWEPEAIPDSNGSLPPDAICYAAALALVASQPNWQGVRLRAHPRPQVSRTRAGERGQLGARNGESHCVSPPSILSLKVSQLQTLFTHWTEEETPPETLVWQVDGGWIELGTNSVGTSKPRLGTVQRVVKSARLKVQQSRAGTESTR